MFKLFTDTWEKVKKVFQPRKAETVVSNQNPPPPGPTHSGSKPPGLDCPQCGFRIIISVPMLLSGQGFHCPVCQLKLNIEMKESKACLDELKKVYDAVQKVEDVKKKH